MLIYFIKYNAPIIIILNPNDPNLMLKALPIPSAPPVTTAHVF